MFVPEKVIGIEELMLRGIVYGLQLWEGVDDRIVEQVCQLPPDGGEIILMRVGDDEDLIKLEHWGKFWIRTQ